MSLAFRGSRIKHMSILSYSWTSPPHCDATGENCLSLPGHRLRGDQSPLAASGYTDSHRSCLEELKSLFIRSRLRLPGERLGKWHIVVDFQRWDSDGEFNRLGCARAGCFLTACVMSRIKPLIPGPCFTLLKAQCKHLHCLEWESFFNLMLKRNIRGAVLRLILKHRRCMCKWPRGGSTPLCPGSPLKRRAVSPPAAPLHHSSG